MLNVISFEEKIQQLMRTYKSSEHQLFKHIKESEYSIMHSYEVLNELYKRYQAAMHATRVMVYFTPHLNTINLRMAKLKIIADDDGDLSGDSHHYQLRRTWAYMLGTNPAMKDDDFGDLDLLKKIVDPATAKFIEISQKYYTVSLGPWIMIEGLAHNWIGAWQEALECHFPNVSTTDYFMHNYANEIEVSHAKASLDLVNKIIIEKPNLIDPTLEGAEKIGQALFTLWDGIDDFIMSQ